MRRQTVSISERVTEVLKDNNTVFTKDESLVKCIEFSKQMEKAGLLDPDRQSTTEILEGGIGQLKLYAQSFNRF